MANLKALRLASLHEKENTEIEVITEKLEKVEDRKSPKNYKVRNKK